MLSLSSTLETVFSKSSSMADVEPVVDLVASVLVSSRLFVASTLDSVASVLDSFDSGGLLVVDSASAGFVTVASNVVYIFKKNSMRFMKKQ